MNVTGPADFIAKLDSNESKARHRHLARRIARRLIAKYRIPQEYLDLARDPFGPKVVTVVDAVMQWLFDQESNSDLTLTEIGLTELERRFRNHLEDLLSGE